MAGLLDYLGQAKDNIAMGLLNQYQQGAPVRQGLAKILSGDTSPLNDIYGQIKQLGNPNYMKQVNDATGSDMQNIALNANPMIAGTIKALTPFEMAHATAQKNAVDMLGLHADNTAMERAKAMGFDTPAYHGTSSDFNAFNTTDKAKTADSGSFFTDNPSVAGTYTMGINNGNILPVILRNDKHLNVDANGKNWNRLEKSTKIDGPAITKIDNETESLLAELEGRDVGQGLITNKKAFKRTLGKQFPDDFKYDDYLSTDDLARWANKEGYGGTTFNNVMDRGPSGAMANAESSFPSNNYAINNPSDIRSRFAAFDPAKAKSSDLLGFADPRLLAGVAGVTGGGLLGANYIKGKK